MSKQQIDDLVQAHETVAGHLIRAFDWNMDNFNKTLDPAFLLHAQIAEKKLANIGIVIERR